MQPLDPFLFLIGHRKAIERIAGSPWAVLVGALFVVTAGLARQYDHLDLLQEWQWLNGPFIISTCSALVVYFSVWLSLRAPVGPRNLLTFLTFFWLTAPCAWLYGIPVERWFSPLGAAQWNMVFLLFVAVWRVLLMTRAVAVLTGSRWIDALLPILMPACLELILASFAFKISLIGMMAGLQLPPHNAWLDLVSGIVIILAGGTFIVSLLLSLTRNGVRKDSPARPHSLGRPILRSSGMIWLLPVVSLAAWVALAMPEQPALHRKFELTKLVTTKQYREAIRYASQFQKTDFPAHEEFPVGSYRQGKGYQLLELLEEMKPEDPSWLREIWTDQLVIYATEYHYDFLLYGFPYDWAKLQKCPGLVERLTAKADAIRANPTEDRHAQRAEQGFLQAFTELKAQADQPEPAP